MLHNMCYMQGGGWCVGEDECLERSEMTMHDGKPGSLGSSTPLLGHPEGCGCMNTVEGGISTDCNCIMLPYLDGASFSGLRSEPVPVKSKPGKYLHYKVVQIINENNDAIIKITSFAFLSGTSKFRFDP